MVFLNTDRVSSSYAKALCIGVKGGQMPSVKAALVGGCLPNYLFDEKLPEHLVLLHSNKPGGNRQKIKRKGKEM